MGQRFVSVILLILLVISAAIWVEGAPAAATQAEGAWITHGPRGGRALALAVSPNFQNDGIAFSGEWLTSLRLTESGVGIVRSGDWGQNWAISDVGTGAVDYASAVHDFAFSPTFASDTTVFAATWGGLFQSGDGGVNWRRLEGAYWGPPGGFTRIAAAPDFAQSRQVLAADQGGLLRSNDGGETWERLDEVGAAADIEYAGAAQTIFSSDGMQVYRSQDAAINWTPVLTAPVTALAASPGFDADQTIYGAGGAHLYTSTDGGATWISRTVATGVMMVNTLAVSPQFATDGTIFAGAANGLYWSQDGGATWEQVAAYQGTAVRSLVISPQWPQHAVLLVGTNEGIYRLLTENPTQDQGVKEAASGFVPLSASPLDWSAGAGLLLTATSNHGIYGSEDGGKSWQAMGMQGFSSYYSFSDVAISPAYSADQTLFAAYLSGTGIGGSVYRSVDGGGRWDVVYSTDYVGDLAISPAFASDQTVFATSGDNGLVRSTNGGDDWEVVGVWPGGVRHGIAQYIALPPKYPTPGDLFVGGSHGFWRLPAGQTTWHAAQSGLTAQHRVVALAASPEFDNDHLLLALAQWSEQPSGEQRFGVFRSGDGGLNWTPSGAGVGEGALFDVTFSPAFGQDQTVYLTTTDGELYRSQDGGQNWASLGRPRGAQPPALYDVIVREDGSVFVGSDVGVWQYLIDPYRSNLPLFYGIAVPF